MMTSSRRHLSADDLKIWLHVTRNVSPLHEAAPRHPAEDQASTAAPVRKSIPPAAIPAPPLRLTPRQVPRTAPLALGATADIDRRTAQRFTRGEMSVDGRIDLHGLTLDQAHAALTSYLRAAHARGARCVLVVTGKGKGQAIGKIRSETPTWLNQPPLRALVLAVAQARTHDGGHGALYVLLKRTRSKG